jgi:hypothetical protein
VIGDKVTGDKVTRGQSERGQSERGRLSERGQSVRTPNETFKDRKKVSCLCKCEILGIYKVTSKIVKKIEEAPPPLEENRGDLSQVRLL